ncbi:MAG TPA: hypothetical protein VLR49_09100 [Ferruginibacter sp.]|nr:hypothetical protein [Ferruginibacter sp.]
MKLRSLILISFLAGSFFLYGQVVGIGTNTPDSNAILDISSSNKGLLLPRITDTPDIAIPAAGMIIYNQNSRSPNYYDGNRWNRVNDPSGNFVPLYGTITYTVSGTSVGGIPFETTELPGLDFSYYTNLLYSSGGGGGTIGNPQDPDSVTFYKEFDGNSIPFKRAYLAGLFIPNIEINEYLPDGTKFYSIKLTTVIFTSQFNFISDKTGKLAERYGINCTTIGYKDWINNKSFSYNTSTRTFGAY